MIQNLPVSLKDEIKEHFTFSPHNYYHHHKLCGSSQTAKKTNNDLFYKRRIMSNNYVVHSQKNFSDAAFKLTLDTIIHIKNYITRIIINHYFNNYYVVHFLAKF